MQGMYCFAHNLCVYFIRIHVAHAGLTMKYDDAPKSRRMNLVISEPLVAWAEKTAKSRRMSVSELVRRALEMELRRSEETAIATAAESLAALYASDAELMAFRAIDGEGFA
jgi:hypothetical protein